MIFSKGMSQYTYRVMIEPDGSFFHAFVPALPGCHTFGKTIFEAQKHLQEAMELYLEVLVDNGESVPLDKSFETFQTVTVTPAKGSRKRLAGQHA